MTNWRQDHRLSPALGFATGAHRGQIRKGPPGRPAVPYITHPVAVTDLLWGVGVRDPDVLMAALLHDTVEDCGVTHEQLVERFGQVVADLVLEVTDDKTLPKNERKLAQVEKAKTWSDGAKLVKLADKTSNLRDLVANPPGWTRKAMVGYTETACQMAKAMGNVNPELEAAFQKAADAVLHKS